ncbi:MAG: hypothetical protein ACRD9Q_04005 [Nitrososphaeraceae archaeon]
MGLVIVLLLYRYISKIKFGAFEIEFKAVMDRLNRASRTIDARQVDTRSEELTEAKKNIDEARGMLELMKIKYDYD